MNLTPLLTAPHPIPLHAIVAIMAVILGGVQLAMPKGGRVHRIMGRIWVFLMVVVAVSGLFIFDLRIIGMFSPIHLLSLLTLWALYRAIAYARAGRIAAHKRAMLILYFLALIVTGAFTFLPGRIMYEVIASG